MQKRKKEKKNNNHNNDDVILGIPYPNRKQNHHHLSIFLSLCIVYARFLELRHLFEKKNVEPLEHSEAATRSVFLRRCLESLGPEPPARP